MIKAILAVGENGEIGQYGDMPWGRRLPKDLEYFKKQTLGCGVVMGNNTFKTLPFKCGLPERDNLILTSSVPKDSRIGYEVIYEAGKYTVSRHNATHLSFFLGLTKEDVWLIGGASIYEQFWGYVTEVHITRVKTSFPDADTFFQPDLTVFEKVGEDIDVSGEDLEAYVEVWRRV